MTPSHFEVRKVSIKKNGVQIGQLLEFEVYELEMRGYEVAICTNSKCSSITNIQRIKSQGNGQNKYGYYSKQIARHGFVMQAYDKAGKAILTHRILPYRQDD